MIEHEQHLESVKQQLESRQKFLEISETNMVAVIEMNLDLTITYVDKTIEILLDTSTEEMMGKSVLEFIHHGDHERMINNSKALFTGGTNEPREYLARKVCGKTFPVMISSVPKYNNTKPMVIRAYAIDLSEYQKHNRAKIKQLEKEKAAAYHLVDELKAELGEKYHLGSIISKNHVMLKIFDTVKTIASVPTSVLITGENGTGKELIAKQLHHAGIRKEKSFVAVNSSALPENLLEAELFGYKAGAYTDAKKDKIGKFQLADGGTLFLDEIGDMPLTIQVKLLRILQERVVTPLGSNDEIPVNVRLVAATNRDLEGMIEEGTFREDLYYRIKVVKIELPPLRQRHTDIPLLCNHFIDHYATLFGKTVTALSNDALRLLMKHTFPGNIRELQNIIEHAVVFSDSETIEEHHLPQDLLTPPENGKQTSEKEVIIAAIKEAGNNKTLAAQKLEMHKTTLFRKIKKYSIQDEII